MSVGAILFDWGDTLMVDFPQYSGPMAEWPRVEAVPHAAEVLATLRRAGWVIALATNAADSGEDEIRTALARAGLDTLIDHVYCSREVGHSKPSAEFFAHIGRDLGLAAHELVMVGDSYPTDIAGALAANISGVLFRPGASSERGSGDPERWRIVGDLAELPDLLAEWPRRRP